MASNVVRSSNLELRVGVFVSAGLVVFAVLVFLLGSRSSLFESRRNFRAVFDTVEGLRVGSSVRMGGIDVGVVSDVKFQNDGKTVVEFGVRASEARFVTEQSAARIDSKGMLGDKLLDVTVGNGTPMSEGSTLPAAPAGGLAAAMSGAASIVNDVRPVVENVRRFTDSLADEAFREDVKRLAHSVADLTEKLSAGESAISRLLVDPTTGQEVGTILADARGAIGELRRTTNSIADLASRARTGPGGLHQLVYGDDLPRFVNSATQLSNELSTLLREARTGPGLAHTLLYDERGGQMGENLVSATENLSLVMNDLRQGRGTLGGLLTDPSIYEDVKRIVGSLERNDILRALVRYSIRQNPRPAPEVERSVAEPPR